MSKGELLSINTEDRVFPGNLFEARQAVLLLPGMENYFKDLSPVAPNIDRELDLIVEDVIKQLDAENMIPQITNTFGWSDAESADFFTHPSRQPFQSKVKFSDDWNSRAGQFITLGLYLRYRYDEEQNKALQSDKRGESQVDLVKAKENLRMFFDYSWRNLYATYVFDYDDEVNGIDPDDRRKGMIHPSTEIIDLFRLQVKEVARIHGVDEEKLYQQVLAVTEGGNYTILTTLLNNFRGEFPVKRVIEKVLEKRVRDQSLAIRKLQLLWAADTYRLLLGLDMEDIYELNELPSGSEIEERLHAFLTNQTFIDDTWYHLRQEALPVVEKWEETHDPMNYFEVLDARANYHHFPDTAMTIEELSRKREKVWAELRDLLPLAFIDTPLSFMDAPLRIGATTRAVNITYYNKEGKLVNAVCLNGRDAINLLREVTGHELGHKLHAAMLKLAEDFGIVPANCFDRVPSAVKEEYSQLLESQVGEIWKIEDQISFASQSGGEDVVVENREFRNLLHAIIQRRQAPYALIQRRVRLEMERLWKSGKRGSLDVEEAERIINEVEPSVLAWYLEGVPIRPTIHTVRNNIDILNPLDGLVYLRRYLVSPIGVTESRPDDSGVPQILSETQVSTKDMKTAFQERFGPRWLKNRDARIVLYGLMVESGKNHDITTYGDFVLNADISKLKEDIVALGIPENLL